MNNPGYNIPINIFTESSPVPTLFKNKHPYRTDTLQKVCAYPAPQLIVAPHPAQGSIDLSDPITINR
jgi:hypothetical protein